MHLKECSRRIVASVESWIKNEKKMLGVCGVAQGRMIAHGSEGGDEGLNLGGSGGRPNAATPNDLPTCRE